MAPLLVTALVGVGVKIATDLLTAGAKKVFGGTAAGQSFSATLDKAKAAVGAGAPVAATPSGKSLTASAATSAIDVGLADRSRVMAAELSAGVPGAARVDGLAAYRRFNEIEAP